MIKATGGAPVPQVERGGRRRALRAVLWLAITVAFVVAIWPKPIMVPGGPSDKIQHVLAFLTLTALGSAAYPRGAALKLGLGLAGFGALIEVVQALPALNRDAELLDWIADVAAVAVVLLAVGLWRRMRPQA